MRGDDDIVEFENGVVRVRRLRVEDVQAGTGNPAFLQTLVRARWSITGPRAQLIRKAAGFIRESRLASTRCRVSCVRGQLRVTKSDSRKTVSRSTSLIPSSAASAGST